jgi:hypothetical protein
MTGQIGFAGPKKLEKRRKAKKHKSSISRAKEMSQTPAGPRSGLQ